jgi:hypothetical protein
MPATENESFGYLPWIFLLLTAIVMLVLYIVVAVV